MIELEHVSCRRGGAIVVRDVSHALEAGCVTVLLGANGAGKTSLLRLMSGEWRPSAGGVLWNGQPIDRFRRGELARRRAVVSQHMPLSFPVRVRDLVLLGRLPHARSVSAEDQAIAVEVLAEVGMGHCTDRTVDTLSGGERQRVQLARALAQLHEARRMGTGVLLLDEPTASLDLAQQRNTLLTARRLAAEGLSVLAILHDVNLAAAYADRVLLLKRGRLLAAGHSRDVLSPALLGEAFDVELLAVAHAGGRTVFTLP